MACFADINVSQVRVATYARCGEIFTIHLTANLLGNLPAKKLNRLRIDRIMVMSLCPRFFGPPRPCRLLRAYNKCFTYKNSVHSENSGFLMS